jgi:hypothetical protein
LKPEILAKNYRYPEEIDAFLDKLEKNKWLITPIPGLFDLFGSF